MYLSQAICVYNSDVRFRGSFNLKNDISKPFDHNIGSFPFGLQLAGAMAAFLWVVLPYYVLRSQVDGSCFNVIATFRLGGVVTDGESI